MKTVPGPLKHVIRIALLCEALVLCAPAQAQSEPRYEYRVGHSAMAAQPGTPPETPGEGGGTPAPSGPVAVATPLSLAFATTPVGSSSTVRSITLSNGGDSALTFEGIGLSAGAAVFGQSNNCVTLAPKGTCIINVSFTPTQRGSFTGTLSLVHDGQGPTAIPLSGEGVAAELTTTVPNFEPVKVGLTSTSTVSVQNTGQAPLSLQAIGEASVTGSMFSFVATTCATSVEPGATCTVTVRFAPTAAGSQSGALHLESSVGTRALTLTAQATQGVLTVTPGNLTFQAQQVASTASAQTITLSNTGTAPLAVSALGIVEGEEAFAQSNNCAVIAPQASCTVSVSFTPTVDGDAAGKLALIHDGAQGVAQVTLQGVGVAATASLSTPTFPATPVNSSSTATATLTNTGIGNLEVSGPSVQGSAFSLTTSTCGSTLAAGATCQYVIKFSPKSSGAGQGSLTVTTAAGEKSVSLGSTGIQGVANVSPGALTYAAQQVSSSSTVQIVTVTNVGTNVLTFSGVGVSQGSAYFGQSNNCASVPVNGTCSINVTFTPTAAGDVAGALSLVHDGGGIANVSLSGTGQAASATLQVQPFTATQVGQSTTAVATLVNTGVGALHLTVPDTAAVTGTGFAFGTTTCTTTLPAGQSCTSTLRFTPQTAGTLTGNFAISTQEAGNKQVALSAEARVPALELATWDASLQNNFNINVPENSASGAWAYYRNAGVGPVTLQSLSWTGSLTSNLGSEAPTDEASKADYTYCWTGRILQPGNVCKVYVYASKTASGSVSLVSTAGTLTFSGQINTAGMVLSGTLTDATVLPGTGNGVAAYTLTLTNPTNYYFHFVRYAQTGALSDVARFTGTDAANFYVSSSTCGVKIAPGSACTLKVAPKANAEYRAYSGRIELNGGYQQAQPNWNGDWYPGPGAWFVACGFAVCDVFHAENQAATNYKSGRWLVANEGYRSWSDGTFATTCREYRFPAEGYGYAGATGTGIYRLDDGDAFCDMLSSGGGWTLVRRTAPGSGWAPATDNVRGTAVYGTYLPVTTVNATFSRPFSGKAYTELAFATGDGVKWLIAPKTTLAAITETCGTGLPVTASHVSASPYTVAWCMRTAQPEDPWVSVYDHAINGGAAFDNDTHSMLYGENSSNVWLYWLNNRNGANVFIR